MKRTLCLAFFFIFMLAAMPNTYAANLEFNQHMYDSLSPPKKEFYEICTKGYKGVHLGSSLEHVITQTGEPTYRTKVGHDEFMIYCNSLSFKFIMFQFSKGQLKSAWCSGPSKEIFKLIRSDIRDFFGKPHKKTLAEMVFKSSDKSKKTTLIYQYTWQHGPCVRISSVVLGNPSKFDYLKHASALIKMVPKYFRSELKKMDQDDQVTATTASTTTEATLSTN